MSDEIDAAQDREQVDRENAIAVARSDATEVPDVGCVDCANLGDPTGKECNYYAGCLEDWGKRKWANQKKP